MSSKFSYGGQAVIEGVMMRGKHFWSIAVRQANQEIVVTDGEVKSITEKYPFLGKPLIRGSVALVEALIFGMRSLTYAANQYGEEEDEELTNKELIFTFAFAIILTVGLFIMLPAYLISLIETAIDTNFILNLVEGLIKISFFVLYIVGISMLKDIRRVFQYHGAEHRTINCYEAGAELNVANVQRQSIIHARCGTNFLLITLFLSAFVFTFFGRPPFLQRVLTHVAILPIVAGLSYELIRKAGQDNARFFYKIIAAPGMALQLLTARKPDDQQAQVAIDALKTVLAKDSSHPLELKVKEFSTVGQDQGLRGEKHA